MVDDSVDDGGADSETTDETATAARLRVLRKRRTILIGILSVLSTLILFLWSSPLVFVVVGVAVVFFVPTIIANNEIVRLDANDTGEFFESK